MTTMSPVQCLACVRLAGTVDPDTGVRSVVRCTAYPAGIPAEIGMYGGDHRTARGDEVDGLIFLRAPGSEADDAWAWWQRKTAAAE
jgi:hypothetical protein